MPRNPMLSPWIRVTALAALWLAPAGHADTTPSPSPSPTATLSLSPSPSPSPAPTDGVPALKELPGMPALPIPSASPPPTPSAEAPPHIMPHRFHKDEVLPAGADALPALPAVPVAPVLAPVAAPAAVAPAASPSPAASPAPGSPPSGSPAPEPTPAAKAVPADIAAVIEKNPDLLVVPVNLGTISVMFTPTDMDTLLPFVDIYDGLNSKKQTREQSEGEDLSSLLQSLKSHDDTARPEPLHNLYLGSIVYYTPSNWSVWINGIKLINDYNSPENEYYVNRLSNKEVELVWKPPSMLEMSSLWDQMTEQGKNPLPNITVDMAKGKVTLLLRPNQTFLPGSLAIREGLIHSGGR